MLPPTAYQRKLSGQLPFQQEDGQAKQTDQDNSALQNGAGDVAGLGHIVQALVGGAGFLIAADGAHSVFHVMLTQAQILLRNKDFAADGASLSIVQGVRLEVAFLCGKKHFLVTLGNNDLLGNK